MPHRETARQTETILKIFLHTSILISAKHSPTTSLSIAIADAIGSSKSHCYLVPISAGATTSAGRQKKAWGRAGKSWLMDWVAMGVAWEMGLS